MPEPTQPDHPAERLKFFTDAVVAIAMTLLIIPLLKDVAEAARADAWRMEYLEESAGQLLSLALSFVIIATFWMMHHALTVPGLDYLALLVMLS